MVSCYNLINTTNMIPISLTIHSNPSLKNETTSFMGSASRYSAQVTCRKTFSLNRRAISELKSIISFL